MKKKYIDAYMDVAERFAQLSSAVRLQVGCVVVRNDNILSFSWNGTPTGWDNCCEEEVIHDYGNRAAETRLKTKAEVIHAESNAISKLARSPESGAGATMFVTHAPCIDCAKLIYQSGITAVYYKHRYRDTAGIKFLEKCGIPVTELA